MKRLQTHKPTQHTLPYRPSPQIERKHIKTHANDNVQQLAHESKTKKRPHSLYIHENNSKTKLDHSKSPKKTKHTNAHNNTHTHQRAQKMQLIHTT